jgi:Tol biopolymer transport system component
VDRFPVSLELDPDYDLFRVLSIDEVPPSLNATLAEPGHAILLPADGEAFSAPHYQEVAKRAERQKEGMILEKGEEIPHRSLLVLGSARLEPAVKEILGRALPEGIVLEQESFSVHGTVYDKPTQSFLLSIRHPDDPNRTVTLYFGLSPEAVARAHSIFFYGWDSYVVFDEGVPVARGEFYPDEKQTRREVAGRVAEGIDLGRIMGHLSNLASDRLRGRFPDTFGSELAKQYIETEFQKAGLAPVFGETGQPSFRQMFSMWLRDLRAGTFLFTGETGIGGGSVIPFSFSAQGNFTLEPVFAGFGLVREGYDDYGNLNVRGKAVLVLDGHPEFLPVESGGAQLVVEKVKTAMDRGASAVLVLQSGTMDADLDPYLTYPSRLPESFRQKLTGSETEDQIFMKIRQRYSMAPGLSADPAIPVGLIEVDKHSIPGLTPSQIVQEVNQTRTPPGREYPGATMNVTVQFRERKISGENVAGLLEGIDPELKNEVVVVGAHFDHLGVDSAENIYHGADDNASGVAALLEAASAFQNWKSGVKRSLLFVAFDAEEWGLYGSRYFVAHFPLPNRRMAAMLNADAIGRGTDGSVYLIGETMYPKLADHARGVMEGLGLNPGENIDPFAYRHGSDHYSFHEKGIPALMFYSSDYGEMNSLNDTVDKILPDNLQRITKLLFLSALSLVSWGEGLDLGTVPEVESPAGPEDETSVQPVAGEVRLKNVRQLTFGGENAEAYFSSDGARLVFQSKRDGMGCDQIFVMEKDGSGQRMVSTGKGATTCSYFVGNDSKILYSSTHAWGEECPERPPFKGGYAWPVFPSYDIYLANADGSDPKRITESEGYDAEATVSPDGKTIVFTSMRDGDLDIYTMDLEGGNVRRLTEEVGYDGGAFFSPDGTKIVYRAHHPKEPEEILDYRELLAQHLVRPGTLEIFVMDADGSNKTQVTRNGAANFAPFFHPDGRRIVFSSNMEDPAKRNFDLYLIHVDGTGLERVTFNPTFDGFPMFSPDGTQLVFASNRNNRAEGETNIFLADWVENPGEENSPAEIETETDD